MALPTSFYVASIYDNTLKSNGLPEAATYRVPVTTLTAANLVAQSALILALQNAIDAITLGNVRKTIIEQAVTEFAVGAATNVLAQRENKWLVRYHGNTLGQKFQMSIPTADLSQLPTHSEFLDIANPGVGADLVDAFEAIVKSPNDGAETVIVDSVQFVGRNT